MRYFPLFVDMQDQRVIVVGGGEPALAKVRLLRKTGAQIVAIAPSLSRELRRLADAGDLAWWQKRFAPSDLDGARIVYAATGLRGIDEAVSRAARARRILVNAVDTPDLCDFLTPALVDRDPVVVAIGTEGAAPVLARDIKAHLDRFLPERIGAFARFAQGLRARVAGLIASEDGRRHFWNAFFKGAPRQAFLSGHEAQAAQLADGLINDHAAGRSNGFVWLVGAGPGDPELLTLKAQRVLQEADVIVTDRLVNPQILEYARRDARRIHAGKTPGQPSISQDEINATLVREAKAGRIVVRLKGGDPFVFGRGGEELAALEAAGVAAGIVPGITAAMSCAASARLPLTTRAVNRAFTLMTGASADGLAEHQWTDLARPGQTFAIYMGIGAAAHIGHSLMQAGIDPATPVIIVENGTLANERIVETRASAIQAAVSAFGIKGPAIIYVGLHWQASGIARPGHVEVFPHDSTIIALPGPGARTRTVRQRLVEGKAS